MSLLLKSQHSSEVKCCQRTGLGQTWGGLSSTQRLGHSPTCLKTRSTAYQGPGTFHTPSEASEVPEFKQGGAVSRVTPAREAWPGARTWELGSEQMSRGDGQWRLSLDVECGQGGWQERRCSRQGARGWCRQEGSTPGELASDSWRAHPLWLPWPGDKAQVHPEEQAELWGSLTPRCAWRPDTLRSSQKTTGLAVSETREKLPKECVTRRGHRSAQVSAELESGAGSGALLREDKRDEEVALTTARSIAAAQCARPCSPRRLLQLGACVLGLGLSLQVLGTHLPR